MSQRLTQRKITFSFCPQVPTAVKLSALRSPCNVPPTPISCQSVGTQGIVVARIWAANVCPRVSSQAAGHLKWPVLCGWAPAPRGVAVPSMSVYRKVRWFCPSLSFLLTFSCIELTFFYKETFKFSSWIADITGSK